MCGGRTGRSRRWSCRLELEFFPRVRTPVGGMPSHNIAHSGKTTQQERDSACNRHDCTLQVTGWEISRRNPIDQRLLVSMIRALSPGSPCGGIGRRGRLKICCRKRRASSSLAGGTNEFKGLDIAVRASGMLAGSPAFTQQSPGMHRRLRGNALRGRRPGLG
jgi:hypothetical protein